MLARFDRMKVTSISVTEMIGRFVKNPNDVEFKVKDVRYDTRNDILTVVLLDVDMNTGLPIPDTEVGLPSLKDWTLL